MKAALYTRYGPPEVIQITDVERPAPKDNEVLLRVRAASVNPYDWHFMRGDTYLIRLMAGLSKPKDQRLGSDVSGRVESVGSNVTQFKPGEQVFGSCRGALRESGHHIRLTSQNALLRGQPNPAPQIFVKTNCSIPASKNH